MSPQSHTFHLVDASPYVFRAHFGLPVTIVDARGRDIGAVRGFTSFLLGYLEQHVPTHVAVAFDESLDTSFRNELFAGYKSSREAAPPEIEDQLERCQDVARVLGTAVFSDPRYEADDLIGTLCARAVRRGHRAVVVSPDKDLMQLVGGAVELFDAARGVRYGPRGVKEKLGVRPEQVPDFLGLAGDAIDDIPGVPGVGRKTASALLARYEDLEEIYGDLDRVARFALRGARALAARLEEHRDQAFLSRELATVATDAPVRAGLGDLRVRRPDLDLAEPLLRELGYQDSRGGLVDRVRSRAVEGSSTGRQIRPSRR